MAHRAEIDSIKAWIYPRVNDGVYRSSTGAT